MLSPVAPRLAQADGMVNTNLMMDGDAAIELQVLNSWFTNNKGHGFNSHFGAFSLKLPPFLKSLKSLKPLAVLLLLCVLQADTARARAPARRRQPKGAASA